MDIAMMGMEMNQTGCSHQSGVPVLATARLDVLAGMRIKGYDCRITSLILACEAGVDAFHVELMHGSE